ncbi:hypothetical protein Tamer19_01670 [Cupriavidus sp. TA19]|nr:hypothetical protein Tamer19_01670 [Cupriavidus sp. TA19]
MLGHARLALAGGGESGILALAWLVWHGVRRTGKTMRLSVAMQRIMVIDEDGIKREIANALFPDWNNRAQCNGSTEPKPHA